MTTFLCILVSSFGRFGLGVRWAWAQRGLRSVHYVELLDVCSAVLCLTGNTLHSQVAIYVTRYKIGFKKNVELCLLFRSECDSEIVCFSLPSLLSLVVVEYLSWFVSAFCVDLTSRS